MNTETQKDQASGIRLHDLEPSLATMRADVLVGLRSAPKYLPSQYLYDTEGAQLFEQICEQPEYYVTRTELGILEANMDSIAASIGPKALLIEPGSGEGVKSALLLGGLIRPAGFVPIDISREQLVHVAETMAARFPDLEVNPICADFTEDPEVPEAAHGVGQHVAFFPGSTIGNLEPEGALDVLQHLRTLRGESGRVLIGVDLEKGREIIEPAYDDAAGVSREFALNYLHRLNRELGAGFDIDGFGYEAPYDTDHGRVEMALVSLQDQSVELGGERIDFAAGERVRTEYSYKYSLDAFLSLAERADLSMEQVWTDPERLFAVVLLGAA